MGATGWRCVGAGMIKIGRYLAIALVTLLTTFPTRAAPLDLTGYTTESGAITIQHDGTTIDAYFVLQALLLADEYGLDIAAYSSKWAAWLLTRQKPDATFDRYCKNGPVWTPCKTADADDSVLALWLKFSDALPAQFRVSPAIQKSRQLALAALTKLVDSARGIYLVSPVYQHGLFMDNLEVWSYRPAHTAAESSAHPNFARSIHKTFWDEEHQRFLVSTQPEQKSVSHGFYPDAVAQIFPLLLKYPFITGGGPKHYQQWIQLHRSEWLTQVRSDFAWGLVAIVALKQGDMVSAGCWLKSAPPHRHSAHWTVTDEVVLQILQSKKVSVIDNPELCK
jgi:hypothetical protein